MESENVPEATETPQKGFLDKWLDKRTSSPVPQLESPLSPNHQAPKTPTPAPIQSPLSDSQPTITAEPTSAQPSSDEEVVFKIR